MCFRSQYNWLFLVKVFFLQLRRKFTNVGFFLFFKFFRPIFAPDLLKLWYIISHFYLACRLLINEYSRFLLPAVLMFYKVDVNAKVANTETLLRGKIQGWVLERSQHFHLLIDTYSCFMCVLCLTIPYLIHTVGS